MDIAVPTGFGFPVVGGANSFSILRSGDGGNGFGAVACPRRREACGDLPDAAPFLT